MTTSGPGRPLTCRCGRAGWIARQPARSWASGATSAPCRSVARGPGAETSRPVGAPADVRERASRAGRIGPPGEPRRRHLFVRTPPAHASARSRRRSSRRRTRRGRRRAARSGADRPDPRPARRRHEPRRERARRDRRGQAQAASASSRTAPTSSSFRSESASDAVRGDHQQACRARRRPLGRARRAHAAAVGADRPELEPGWDMFAPSSGNYGIDLPGARDITLGSPSITIGVIDTGYRPHVDLTGRFVAGYDFIGDTLVANDGNGRDSDALDPGDWITSAENASGYFAGCGVSQQLVARHPRVGHDRRRLRQRHRRRRDQPGLARSSRCACSASAAATRATSRTRFAGPPGCPSAGIPNNNPTPDRVVNISLGGSGACDSITQNAINAAVAAGTVVVVAAGNSNAQRGELHPGQLRQRDHGRRHRATPASAPTTRTTAPRSRSPRRVATPSSARRSSRR